MAWCYRSLRFLTSSEVRLAAARGLATAPSGVPAVGTTLSKQKELKRLGVQDLAETMERFLYSSSPFLTDQELAQSKKTVAEFVTKGGQGENLQNLLLQKAQREENWLADWWMDVAYMGYRDSVIINSNPGITWPKRTFKGNQDFLDYTAKVIAGLVDFKGMLDKQIIPIEMRGKEPMDMEQYFHLIGTTRIPGRNKDSLHLSPNSQHIVVIRNNQFYSMPVYDQKTLQPLSEDVLVRSLQNIINHENNNKSEGDGVGILTADDRDSWGEARELLHPGNEDTFKAIENALFVVCLDPAFHAATNLDEDRMHTLTAQHAVHGQGLGNCTSNRWFDKAIQVFVTESGESGVSYEHSPAEAVAVMNMSNHVLHCVKGGQKLATEGQSTEWQEPLHLPFRNLDRVKTFITKARKDADKAISNLELHVMHFRSYGKGFTKSQYLSPDSFFQTSVQLAFYRLHNTPGATYESGGLRIFRRGRTDIIRSCLPETVGFAQTMLRSDSSQDEKLKALKTAISAHSNYAKLATEGKGIDRHLLGLKKIAVENGLDVPKLFQDPAYTRSTRHRLSTSQVSGKFQGVCNFGPLVNDGYACCYNIREHDILACVSAFNDCTETSAEKLKASIEESLHDIHDLLIEAKQQAKL